MQKPISLIFEDFKKELGELINKYKLPAFMIEPVLQTLLNEVAVLKIRQYEVDKEIYEKSFVAEVNKIDDGNNK